MLNIKESIAVPMSIGEFLTYSYSSNSFLLEDGSIIDIIGDEIYQYSNTEEFINKVDIEESDIDWEDFYIQSIPEIKKICYW